MAPSSIHSTQRVLMKAISFKQGWLTAMAALSLCGSAMASDLVANGAFEAGSLAGWSGSVLTNPYSGVVCLGAGSVPEGSCEAFLGTSGSADTLTQALSTVAGQAYAISFLLQSDGSVPSDFSVRFGDQWLYTSATRLPPTTPTVLSFTAAATAETTSLTFSFRNDPGYFVLDAVSVTAVPEPSALPLMLLGVGAIAVWRRRPGPSAVA